MGIKKDKVEVEKEITTRYFPPAELTECRRSQAGHAGDGANPVGGRFDWLVKQVHERIKGRRDNPKQVGNHMLKIKNDGSKTVR